MPQQEYHLANLNARLWWALVDDDCGPLAGLTQAARPVAGVDGPVRLKLDTTAAAAVLLVHINNHTVLNEYDTCLN